MCLYTETIYYMNMMKKYDFLEDLVNKQNPDGLKNQAMIRPSHFKFFEKHCIKTMDDLYEKFKCPYCNNLRKIFLYPRNFTKLGIFHDTCCSDECIIKNLKSVEILNKKEITTTKRYGTKHVMQSKEVKQIYKDNYREKHGVENPFQNPDIQQKMEQTNLERYGTKKYGSSNDMRIKRTQTFNKRYGSDTYWESNMFRKHMEQIGVWLTEEQQKPFRMYKNKVIRYTKKSIKEFNIQYDSNTHQLDHRYSIFQGFLDNIDSKIIGSYKNLEILTIKENLKKNLKCSTTLEELK